MESCSKSERRGDEGNFGHAKMWESGEQTRGDKSRRQFETASTQLGRGAWEPPARQHLKPGGARRRRRGGAKDS